MEDEGGVLGNLPRSRPGRRSQKRASDKTGLRAAGKRPADAAKQAAAGAERRGARAARSASQERPAPAPAAKDTTRDDPMGDAMRLATQVPLVGVRVAAGVTRELLRRLPRP